MTHMKLSENCFGKNIFCITWRNHARLCQSTRITSQSPPYLSIQAGIGTFQDSVFTNLCDVMSLSLTSKQYVSSPLTKQVCLLRVPSPAVVSMKPCVWSFIGLAESWSKNQQIQRKISKSKFKTFKTRIGVYLDQKKKEGTTKE